MTQGYTLRLYDLQDAPLLAVLFERNRSRLLDYFPNTAREVIDNASCETYIQNKIDLAISGEAYSYLIISPSGQPIGFVNLKNIDHEVSKGELSYSIDAAYEGRGIISSAIQQTIKYAFSNQKLNKLFIRLSTINDRSRHVAERHGFRLEGTLRKDFLTGNDVLTDIYYYGLLREEWLSANGEI
jgi:ribosomal-protein-serine acetyltransferase